MQEMQTQVNNSKSRTPVLAVNNGAGTWSHRENDPFRVRAWGALLFSRQGPPHPRDACVLLPVP